MPSRLRNSITIEAVKYALLFVFLVLKVTMRLNFIVRSMKFMEKTWAAECYGNGFELFKMAALMFMIGLYYWRFCAESWRKSGREQTLYHCPNLRISSVLSTNLWPDAFQPGKSCALCFGGFLVDILRATYPAIYCETLSKGSFSPWQCTSTQG